jgi:hypothetical protein
LPADSLPATIEKEVRKKRKLENTGSFVCVRGSAAKTNEKEDFFQAAAGEIVALYGKRARKSGPLAVY